MKTSRFSAGVAREVISPPKGIYLIGYGDRTKGNAGVHDDLTATALVINDGRTQVAIVACDLLCLNEFVVDRIREGVGSNTQVIICCSHTHAGPIAYANSWSKRSRRMYIDWLVDRITQAVHQAESSLIPASICWGETEADVAVNRREMQADGEVVIGVNREGYVDRTVSVLEVCDLDGSPMATLINYACHGVVLGPTNLLVSADWVGAMRSRIEDSRGSQVLFLQGATANLNPDRLLKKDDPWESVAALGNRVATQVLDRCDLGLTELRATPLSASREELWLPLEAAATTSTPPRTYRRVLLRFVGLPQLLKFVADPLLNQRYPWRSRIEARDGVWSVPLRINAVRIGELSLVTFAAEVFAEIGMAVKSASPAAASLFASVSDGCIGYLPTAEAHAEGGYEVDISPYFYRYPGRMSAGNAEVAINASARLLRQLW
jgi:hypothetical protein